MDIELLLEKVFGGKTLEVYEEIYQLFSEKISEEFINNSEVYELLIEFTSNLESSKAFDKLIRFLDLVREKNPSIYQDYSMYLDDCLIDYYCFLGEKEKIFETFSSFLASPDKDIDFYSINLLSIIYYQNTEIIENAIIQNYEIIRDSEYVVGNPEWLLQSCKYHLELEKLYKSDNSVFDKKSFSEKIKLYDYQYDAIAISSIEEGLFKPQKGAKEWVNFFQKDHRKAILMIKYLFLKNMLKKGVHFYLGSLLYFNIIAFLTNDNKRNKKKNHTLFFDINLEQFQSYVQTLENSSFSEKKTEVVALIWGSVYLYEILRNNELISSETFNSFLTINRKMKGIFITERPAALWQYNFVHLWEKPDCISENEFRNEESIFRKSLYFENIDFSLFEILIANELQEIGVLATSIREGKKLNKEMLNNLQKNYLPDLLKILKDVENDEELIDYDEFDDFEDYENFKEDDEFDDFEDANIEEPIKPIRKERKIGRNEPCPCGSGKKYKKCCGKIV